GRTRTRAAGGTAPPPPARRLLPTGRNPEAGDVPGSPARPGRRTASAARNSGDQAPGWAMAPGQVTAPGAATPRPDGAIRLAVTAPPSDAPDPAAAPAGARG